MKHIIILLTIFIGKTGLLIAQDHVQEFPALHKQNPDIHFERMSVSDETGFYAVFSNKKLKNYSVQKFDFQSKLIFSLNFQEEPVYEVIYDKSMYVFTSEFDKSSGKKGKLYMSEVNIPAGTKSPAKVIDEIEVIKEHDFNFEFSLSPDKSKLLVSVVHCPAMGRKLLLSKFTVSK